MQLDNTADNYSFLNEMLNEKFRSRKLNVAIENVKRHQKSHKPRWS